MTLNENNEQESFDSITAQFKDAFTSLDKECAGKLRNDLLESLCRSLGQIFTEAEIQDMLQEIDPKKDGFFTFKRFLKLSSKFKLTESLEELQDAFRIMDTESVGYFTEVQIMDFSKLMGEMIEEEEIEVLMKDLNKTKNGKVDVEEFITFMQRRDLYLKRK